MQVVLPDVETRATFEIRAERPMDEEEFFEFCAKNPELRIERNVKGEIIIMPLPAPKPDSVTAISLPSLPTGLREMGAAGHSIPTRNTSSPTAPRYRQTLPGCRAAGWCNSPRNRSGVSCLYVRIS